MTICAPTKTDIWKLPKLHTKRQTKLAVWSLMVKSFSVSCYNFFTFLILTTWKNSATMQTNYMLPYVSLSLFFSSFSFSFCCLCSAYILLIVSLLALSALSYVHCSLHSATLTLLITYFKNWRFLCYSTPFVGVLVYQQYLGWTHHCLIYFLHQ